MNLAQYEAYHQPWGGDPESRWTRTYEMPFAIAGGIAAGSALAAGTVAAGAATVAAIASVAAGVLMAASWALVIVGVATGDKNLVKIGGFVGMAGGVAGGIASVAGVGISAAETAAAPAASSAAGSGASAGGAGAVTGAAGEAAITPTFSAAGQEALNTGATTAAQSAGQTATQSGTGLLASETAQGATTSSLGLGTDTAGALSNVAPKMASLGSDVGSSVGTNVGTGLGSGTSVSNQSSSFFDKITSTLGSDTTKNVLDVGGKIFQGIGNQSNTDTQNRYNQQQLQLQRDQYNNNLMMQERQYQNANTQGRLSLDTAQLTPEQRAQTQMDQANLAKQQAKILTAPAGA